VNLILVYISPLHMKLKYNFIIFPKMARSKWLVREDLHKI